MISKAIAETICEAINDIETGRALIGVALLRNLLRNNGHVPPPPRVFEDGAPLDTEPGR